MVAPMSCGRTARHNRPPPARKTTLLSQLTGQLAPNSGTIHFAGRESRTCPYYRRSALGWPSLVPDYSLLKDFTAMPNVALAAQDQ